MGVVTSAPPPPAEEDRPQEHEPVRKSEEDEPTRVRNLLGRRSAVAISVIGAFVLVSVVALRLNDVYRTPTIHPEPTPLPPGSTQPAAPPAPPSLPPPHVFKGPDGEWHPADGYAWMANPHLAGDVRVRWAVAQLSNIYPHIETSETEGQWRPAEGYTWVAYPPVLGSTGVKWTLGRPSARYPHVVAGELEDQWYPADGYTWVDNPPSAPSHMRVKWSLGAPLMRTLTWYRARRRANGIPLLDLLG